MRFDRGIRSFIGKPFPSGYFAPPTEASDQITSPYEIGREKDGGIWLENDALPSLLKLYVRVTPTWVDRVMPSVQFDDSKPCWLYQDQRCISSVQVDYAGKGEYQISAGKTTMPFQGTQFLGFELGGPFLLLQKTFQVQSAGHDIHWDFKGINKETIPLWAYGGQQRGEDILPFVFTLEESNDLTHVSLTTLSYWHEQGISLPQGGCLNQQTIIYKDSFTPDEACSLKGSFEAGRSFVSLILGRDEKGAAVAIPYHSYRFSNGFVFYKRRT